MYFRDRVDAGQRLVRFLEQYKNKEAVVYALPRGGVVLGAEIARSLNLPLDLIVARKIGHPDYPEYAIGAIAADGHLIVNPEHADLVVTSWFGEEAEKQRLEAKRRQNLYKVRKDLINCYGKTAILVDDGIATGFTLKTAIKELRMHYKPRKIVVAVPVVLREIVEEFEKEGVEVVPIIIVKESLGSIGEYYQSFPPVGDREVINLLHGVKGFSKKDRIIHDAPK